MGRLDQYAKEIFATETEPATRGAVVWRPPTELSLTDVRLDGSLLVRDPAPLVNLPLPWPLAFGQDEIVFEAKMQGDHLDLRASERACLRRQARQVQRMEEDPEHPWDGDLPLWVLAARVPAVLRQRRTVRAIGDGCHVVQTGSYPYLWIAANELPLRIELLPFLIARTGRALDELGRWVLGQRSRGWLTRMVDSLPMSDAVFDEFFRFLSAEPEDEDMARKQKIGRKVLLEMSPEYRDEIETKARAEGRLAASRDHLRRVLARRKVALGVDDEARIDACTDLATLERWLDQAVDAATVAEALK